MTLGKGKKQGFPGVENPGKRQKTEFPRGWDTAGRPRRRRLVHPSAAWEPREMHKSGFPGGAYPQHPGPVEILVAPSLFFKKFHQQFPHLFSILREDGAIAIKGIATRSAGPIAV